MVKLLCTTCHHVIAKADPDGQKQFGIIKHATKKTSFVGLSKTMANKLVRKNSSEDDEICRYYCPKDHFIATEYKVCKLILNNAPELTIVIDENNAVVANDQMTITQPVTIWKQASEAFVLRKVCNSIQRGATCTFGESCRYSHKLNSSIHEAGVKPKKLSNNQRAQITRSAKASENRAIQTRTLIQSDPEKKSQSRSSSQKVQNPKHLVARDNSSVIRDLKFYETYEYLAEKLSSDEFRDYVLNSEKLTPSSMITERMLKLYVKDRFLLSPLESKVSAALSIFINSRFYRDSVPLFIRHSMTGLEVLECIMVLFEACLDKCPSVASQLCVSDLVTKFRDPQSYLQNPNYERNELRHIDARLTSLQNKHRTVEMNNMNLSSGNKVTSTNGEIEETWYMNASIVPTVEELQSASKNLQQNIISGSYPSFQHYIYTHFTLLKEDYIHSLREGLSSYGSNKFNPKDLPVFTNTRIQSIQYVSSSISFEVSFEQYGKKKKKSKARMLNLKLGSLVCLYLSSEDKQLGKKDVIFATVSGRHEIEKGIISISPYSKEDSVQLYSGLDNVYLMIESPVYFKSVEPVLQGLIEMRETDLSALFKDVLVNANYRIDPPLYIQQNPEINLQCISKNSRMPMKVNVLQNWADENSIKLDSSQSKAVQNALRSSISIIQGPPGTGKTFTGVHLTRIIHSALQNGRAPHKAIVCICYTNHALDQFLEALLPYIPNLVRIGGRSKSTNQNLLDRNVVKLVSNSGKIRYLDREIHCSIDNIRSYIKNWKEETGDSLLATYASPFLLAMQTVTSSNNIAFFINNRRKAYNVWLEGKETEYADELLKRKTNMHKKKKSSVIRVQNRFGALIEPSENTAQNTDVLLDTTNIQIAGNQDHIIHESFEDEEQVGVLEQPVPRNTTDQNETESEDESDDEQLEHILRDEMQEYEEEIRANEEYYYDEDMSDVEYTTGANSLQFEFPQSMLNRDPFAMNVQLRKHLMNRILEIRKKQYLACIQQEISLTQQKIKEREEFIENEKRKVLLSCPLIGLTSTAAATHRNLLKSLKAPVYIFEEAAELLESQILSCLNRDIQHLIMIGDEQQLRPKVNCFQLERKYNLAVSLFERLVMNQYPKDALNTQLRMRPEVSAIVRNFYPGLIDHESTKNRDPISGMVNNVMFVDHTTLEDAADLMRSKCNTFEAQFCFKLTQYLLNQPNYKQSDITILSPYKGQVYKIKELLFAAKLKDVRVVTVDDYQGEENKIVILSLVRSNRDESLGFVKIQNRMIVSLSRARDGLFVFGNSEFLQTHSEDWYKVLSFMKQKKQVSPALITGCPKHPATKTEVRTPRDFDPIVHGGCTVPCEFQLSCGHACPMRCHPNDDHSKIRCTKVCGIQRTCGHTCKKKCHTSACGPCTDKVPYRIPVCGHTVEVTCSVERSTVQCNLKCGRKLQCGHTCQRTCSECSTNGCGPCRQKINGNTCNHCNKEFAFVCGTEKICTNVCRATLDCGHPCSGTCGECHMSKVHPECRLACERLLFCGHICTTKHPCSEPCPDCQEPCMRKCSHYPCRKKCHEPCLPCRDPCKIHCEHNICSKQCHEECNREPCEERCSHRYPKCGHQCTGLCGEQCPPCMICDQQLSENNQWKCTLSLSTSSELNFDVERVYCLPDCQHIFCLDYLDHHMASQATNYGHASIGHKKCPNCNTAIISANRYMNNIKTVFRKIEGIKQRIIQQRKEKEQQEIRDVVLAVSSREGGRAGHWYECPNGHAYFIGECGGPMEVSKCPDCGAAVGGRDHISIASNTRSSAVERFFS